jgi:hypothetical protein
MSLAAIISVSDAGCFRIERDGLSRQIQLCSKIVCGDEGHGEPQNHMLSAFRVNALPEFDAVNRKSYDDVLFKRVI